MYYLRSVDLGSLAVLAGVGLSTVIGGWLLIRAGFRVKPREAPIAGAALGLLVYMVLTNLLAQVIPTATAYTLGGLATLATGVLSALLGSRLRLADLLRDRVGLALLVPFLILFALFQGIERGLAVFDEYLHLPLVSVMAAGDVPPHFYLDPSRFFAYHYGLHIVAAAAVRLGGFMPWSAFDLARSAALTLAAFLAWLWLRRSSWSSTWAGVGAGGLMLVGGTRWLLLMLPGRLYRVIDDGIGLINTGANTAATLGQALVRPWVLEGGGPFPFPFAFHNGIFQPLIFWHGSSGAAPYVAVLLLLLLAGRVRTVGAAAVARTLLLASLALTSEHWFALIWIGLAAAVVGRAWAARSGRRRRGDVDRPWWIALAASAVLSAAQGGFITEALLGWFATTFSTAGPGANVYGFGLRWPPAMPDAHFGDLVLHNPVHALVLVAELGPVVLAAVWMTTRLRAWSRAGRTTLAALAVAGLLGLVFPTLVRYGVDRSSTRFGSTSLWTAAALAAPGILGVVRRGRWHQQLTGGVLAGAACFGGVVLFGVELMAVPVSQYSYFIQPLDTAVAARYWDRLDPRAQVFDPVPSRAVTLFGRAARAHRSIYEPFPEWRDIARYPVAAAVAKSGFTHVYADSRWWAKLDPEVIASYREPCVRLVDELSFRNVEFRRLYEVSACAP